MIKAEPKHEPPAAPPVPSITTPLARAWLSLEGLSVGDAFGERAFGTAFDEKSQRHDSHAQTRWHWTDDTAMALAIVEVLERFGTVNQAELAAIFARNYGREPARGYGAGAHRILSAMCERTPWRIAAQTAFGGEGSCGNGGGMRAAPLGAYFCDDLERVVVEARVSAEPTHLHLDGIAGAIGIAVTAAMVFAGERNADYCNILGAYACGRNQTTNAALAGAGKLALRRCNDRRGRSRQWQLCPGFGHCAICDLVCHSIYR